MNTRYRLLLIAEHQADESLVLHCINGCLPTSFVMAVSSFDQARSRFQDVDAVLWLTPSPISDPSAFNLTSQPWLIITDKLSLFESNNTVQLLQRPYTEAELTQRLTALCPLASNDSASQLSRLASEVDELRGSEKRYRTMVDSSTSIILEWDLDGRITYMNHYGLAFFGYTANELFGRNVLGTIVAAEDSNGNNMQRKMELVVQRPDEFTSSENENVKKNGDKVWIAWTNTIAYNDHGQKTGVLSVGIDRTRQHELERSVENARLKLEDRVNERTHELNLLNQQLLNNEAKLRHTLNENERILENLQDGYTQGDLKGLFIKANREAAAMFGYDSPDELIGQPNTILYQDPAQRDGLINALAKDKKVKNYVLLSKSKQGVLRWVAVSGQYRYDENGQIIGTEALIRDIHERYLLQQELSRQRDDLIRSNEALQKRFFQTVNVLSRISEIRDRYTAQHQHNVQTLAVMIAQELHLSDEVIQNLSYGALLHDIGKMYISHEILNKPDKISPVEFELIKTHVDIAYDIIQEIDFPESIALMVRQHHERLDGSGYPLGLKGDAIRIESLILGVADVVDAISSDRPYRPSLGIGAAMDELKRYRGIKYDERIVDVCLKLIETQRYTMPPAKGARS